MMSAAAGQTRLARSGRIPPPWVLTALGCLCLAGLADAVIRHERGASGDEPFYLLMAEHPGATHSFPYAFRVAVPWLVHILPFAHIVSFQLITLLCVGLAGGVLFLLLQEFEVAPALASGLALTMAACPNLLVLMIRHGQGVDAATTLVMITGTLFIVRRQRAAFAAVVLIGAAVKETDLFLVPFAYIVSFQLITLLCIGLAGAVLFLLLQEFEVAPALAAGLALTMAVCPNLLVLLIRHGQGVDAATTLVMIAGTLFIVRRNRAAFAAVVLIGAAVKETDLFLLPLAYAVWARRPLDREALRDTVLTGAGGVLVYLALRLGVHGVGSNYTPGYSGSFLRQRWHVFKLAFTGTELRRLAYAFGPMWVVAPFALRSLSFARRGLALVGLCVVGLTVSFDAGRTMFPSAPVFYVATAWVSSSRRRLAIAVLIALVAVDVGYAVYMQVHGVAHGIDGAGSGPIPVR